MMLLKRLMTVAALTGMLAWAAPAAAQHCPSGNCGTAGAFHGGGLGGCGVGCPGYNDWKHCPSLASLLLAIPKSVAF